MQEHPTRVAVIREKMDDLVAAAQQAEQDIKHRGEVRNCDHATQGELHDYVVDPTDVVDGSVKRSFEMLKPWIRNAHINDLSNNYPWRELFKLLIDSGYERYTLAEVDPESKEPERFLSYYRALWTELNRACA